MFFGCLKRHMCMSSIRSVSLPSTAMDPLLPPNPRDRSSPRGLSRADPRNLFVPLRPRSKTACPLSFRQRNQAQRIEMIFGAVAPCHCGAT